MKERLLNLWNLSQERNKRSNEERLSKENAEREELWRRIREGFDYHLNPENPPLDEYKGVHVDSDKNWLNFYVEDGTRYEREFTRRIRKEVFPGIKIRSVRHSDMFDSYLVVNISVRQFSRIKA